MLCIDAYYYNIIQVSHGSPIKLIYKKKLDCLNEKRSNLFATRYFVATQYYNMLFDNHVFVRHGPIWNALQSDIVT